MYTHSTLKSSNPVSVVADILETNNHHTLLHTEKTDIYIDIYAILCSLTVNHTQPFLSLHWCVHVHSHTEDMKELIHEYTQVSGFTDTYMRSDLRCSFLPGVSVCACRRGRYGEGRGSGMDETSWVWSGYQWGLSSSKAVSSSMRIC